VSIILNFLFVTLLVVSKTVQESVDGIWHVDDSRGDDSANR